jgi:hypothetical protein
MLSFDVSIWFYHLVSSFILCYHLMLSFLTVCKCYHFCVIFFPCTGWVLSFMLSFNVITFCYHFPPFSFSWKRDTLARKTLVRYFSAQGIQKLTWQEATFRALCYTGTSPTYLYNDSESAVLFSILDTHWNNLILLILLQEAIGTSKTPEINRGLLIWLKNV